MARLVTTEEIISRFKKVHGDRYDYSLVDYVMQSINVKIKCNIHGIFLQSPSNHLAGKGCKLCGYKSQSKIKTKTTEEFIKEAESIHGNKYDYSKVDYKNGKNHVIITCPEHGDFLQSPNNHTHFGGGKGCPKCALVTISSKKTLTKGEFIERCLNKHGNKYDYSLVDYKGSNNNIKIICPIHGLFSQNPYTHINSFGCPKCGMKKSKNHKRMNPPGWTITNWESSALKSKNFDSFKVYIIRCWNNNEWFYKIGRTFSTINRRFKNNTAMPYNYEVINEFIFETAKGAFDKENELKSMHKNFKYLPKIKFDGMHECFYSVKYDK